MRVRYPVRKTATRGVLGIRREDFGFFGLDGRSEATIELVLPDGQKIPARASLHAGGRRASLVFTGEQGRALRRLIKQRARKRQGRPWGAIVFSARGDSSFDVDIEGPAEAEVQVLRIARRHFLPGARSRCLLNPAVVAIDEVLDAVRADTTNPEAQLCRELERAGWRPVRPVIPVPVSGFRLNDVQLRPVFALEKLAHQLLEMLLGMRAAGDQLGIILVPLSRRLAGAESRNLYTKTTSVIDRLSGDFPAPLAVFGLRMVARLRSD